MSDSKTDRLGMPLLDSGQAQKEMSHNEALIVADLLLQGSVEQFAENNPPASPQPGQAWIVGDAPTGDWSGFAGQVAGFTQGGWRFVVPVEGMTLWDCETRMNVRYSDGSWQAGVLQGTTLMIDGTQVVGSSAAAIADPTGGATVDAEARNAIMQMLSALRGHGLIASE